jgi:2-succinyl-6-hydroxy-2,4-cyclohexadiene-1-carboxylate synthase
MKINLPGVNLNVEIYSDEIVKNKVFFLHGFTGSSDDWKNIIPNLNKNFNVIAVDLVGHGKSDSPKNLSLYQASSIVNQLKTVIDNFTKDKVVLAGYSMGGRAALNFAVEYPEMIKGLILESTSAGIKNENMRNERIKNDESLADFIEQNPIEKFIEKWMGMEIFNTQKRFSNAKLDELKRGKLYNSKTGLANSLRGFGTGTMIIPPEKLKNINAKVLLITGELDVKFTSINSKLVKQFRSAHHKIIKSSGHNTHLEEPKAYLEVVNKFLENFNLQ